MFLHELVPVFIYTYSKYTFGVAHNFGILQKQHVSHASSRNKIVICPYIQKLLDAIFLPAASTIINFQSIFNLTLWNLGEITLLTFPQKKKKKKKKKKLTLKEPIAAKLLSWFKEIFPQMIPWEKSCQRTQQFSLNKGKARLDIQQSLV